MAKVFRPNPERLKALGYARLAHVPVLFDATHRYCREYNWYLRDRATRGLDWTEITYDDIIRYQDDQADGSWSTDGRRLGSGTINHRADEATNFLRWAAFHKLRPPIEVKAVTSHRIVTSSASSKRGVAFRKARAGRSRRGYVKYLACRFILEGGPRRHEVEQITDDLWPSKAV
jgi:hypothetical protein